MASEAFLYEHQRGAYRRAVLGRRAPRMPAVLLHELTSTTVVVRPTSGNVVIKPSASPNLSDPNGRQLPAPFMVRRWWFRSGEGYRPDEIYQRRYYFHLAAEPTFQPAQAVLTVEAEAPTLDIFAGTSISVTPEVATLTTKTVPAPSLVKVQPQNSIIPRRQTTWQTTSTYSPLRESEHHSLPFRRPQSYIEHVQYHVRRVPRAIWYDRFATTEAVIVPVAATLAVETDGEPNLQFGAGVTNPVTNTVAVKTQSPNILLDGQSPLGKEVAVVNASRRRRQRRARYVDYVATREMLTRILHVYVEAFPGFTRTPPGAELTVETEAPTLAITAEREIAVSAEATLTVETGTPTLVAQAENEPLPAIITIELEAPTVVAAIDALIISPPSPARLEIITEPAGISDVTETVFPGGNGVDTVTILVETEAPTLIITGWTKEPDAVDNWSVESSASDDWAKEPAAASGWVKI